MQYKKAHPFYATEAWQRVRRLALARDGGMCQDCMQDFGSGLKSRPRRATLVHHIKPREDYPELALDLANLVSLCSVCHAARHPEKGQKGGKDEPKHLRVIKV